jgi:hypothetical protein
MVIWYMFHLCSHFCTYMKDCSIYSSDRIRKIKIESARNAVKNRNPKNRTEFCLRLKLSLRVCMHVPSNLRLHVPLPLCKNCIITSCSMTDHRSLLLDHSLPLPLRWSRAYFTTKENSNHAERV